MITANTNLQNLTDHALKLQAQGHHIDAVLHFDAAIDAHPQAVELLNKPRFVSVWQGFHQAQNKSAWRYYDRLQRLIMTAVTQGLWTVGEMALASPLLSNLDLLFFTQQHAQSVLEQNSDAVPFPIRTPSADKTKKIKLGFVGADFYAQATAYLLTCAVSYIDRSQFEVYAYDYGQQDDDPHRQQAIHAYDHLISLHGLSDQEAAQRIYDDEIDILFNIKNAASARLGIFLRRPAPCQVNYLYYPGTAGMPFFDALVGDDVVTPPEFEYAYAEKIWRIEGCYQPNDEGRVLPGDFSKSNWGLPEDKIVLANLSQNYKITPTIFDLWMRVMLKHSNCVLLLLADDDEVMQNLRYEAWQRGVNPNRLYFSPPIAIDQHLSRLRTADLILDTFPYGGHTLTSDALWAGTPVVTMQGDTFASRVPASLLSSVGLSELVTHSHDGYINLIDALIQDAPRRAAYRAHLTEGRHRFALFDSVDYARRFERMIKRYVLAE